MLNRFAAVLQFYLSGAVFIGAFVLGPYGMVVATVRADDDLEDYYEDLAEHFEDLAEDAEDDDDDRKVRLHFKYERGVDPAIIANVDVNTDEELTAGLSVLNSGPIHEAFASPISFDPEPGILIARRPPDLIAEVPSLDKPASDNIAWIPGYWSWDEDRNNYIWISGVWRNIPPDRQWVPGYWARADAGYRWISGVWTAASRDISYLPTPPENADEGPVGEAPSLSHAWVPGTWLYRDAHYVWRPGYWLLTPPNWVWTPAQYIWTPLGSVFVGGFWDYELERRGLLFAPVIVEPAYYAHPVLYRPSIVVDVNVAADYFFVRPNYRHYYFGDYYDDHYLSVGIYPNFAFHYSRFGYDPIYVHRSIVYGGRDPRWAEHGRDRYRHLVANRDARPHRLYSARGTGRAEVTFARPVRQYVTRGNHPLRFERADSDRLRTYNTRARETRKFQRERREVEARRPAIAADTRRDATERRLEGESLGRDLDERRKAERERKTEVTEPRRDVEPRREVEPRVERKDVEPRREVEPRVERREAEPKREVVVPRSEETNAQPQPFRLQRKSPIVGRSNRELSKDDQPPPARPKVPEKDANIRPAPKRTDGARRPDPQTRLRSMTRSNQGDEKEKKEKDRDRK